MSDNWSAYLDQNEKIIWQGRPDPRLSFAIEEPMQHLMGVFFVGFSIFWMQGASQAGGFFWMFGLIFFFAGLFFAVGEFFWRAYRRSQTWNALTDTRAFIATDLPFVGRSLESYPITQETALTFKPGESATIHFAKKETRSRRSTKVIDVGFERIPDGEAVLALFRQVQREQA